MKVEITASTVKVRSGFRAYRGEVIDVDDETGAALIGAKLAKADSGAPAATIRNNDPTPENRDPAPAAKKRGRPAKTKQVES